MKYHEAASELYADKMKQTEEFLKGLEMARMKKVDLVAKVAKEQNLDPEQIERLPMIELEKMDKVVPDEDGSDILADAPTKRLLGYHPITGAEVFAE